MLFSERSIWTMVHGIGLGGGALIGLAAALFYVYAARSSDGAGPPPGSGALAGATVLSALLLWLTVIVGTCVIFPPYRVTPPAGATDLSEFPRAFVLANPSTAWLHGFAMEGKEHMPWIASMLTTAVAFVAVRYRSRVLQNLSLRSLSMALPAISFALVGFVSLMGMFVNKVAPLNEASIFAAPTLNAPAGGVSGRTTLATIVWLMAWALLHNRWKGREIAPGRVSAVTLIPIALGVLGTFPPVWALL